MDTMISGSKGRHVHVSDVLRSIARLMRAASCTDRRKARHSAVGVGPEVQALAGKVEALAVALDRADAREAEQTARQLLDAA